MKEFQEVTDSDLEGVGGGAPQWTTLPNGQRYTTEFNGGFQPGHKYVVQTPVPPGLSTAAEQYAVQNFNAPRGEGVPTSPGGDNLPLFGNSGPAFNPVTYETTGNPDGSDPNATKTNVTAFGHLLHQGGDEAHRGQVVNSVVTGEDGQRYFQSVGTAQVEQGWTNYVPGIAAFNNIQQGINAIGGRNLFLSQQEQMATQAQGFENRQFSANDAANRADGYFGAFGDAPTGNGAGNNFGMGNGGTWDGQEQMNFNQGGNTGPDMQGGTWDGQEQMNFNQGGNTGPDMQGGTWDGQEQMSFNQGGNTGPDMQGGTWDGQEQMSFNQGGNTGPDMQGGTWDGQEQMNLGGGGGGMSGPDLQGGTWDGAEQINYDYNASSSSSSSAMTDGGGGGMTDGGGGGGESLQQAVDAGYSD